VALKETGMKGFLILVLFAVIASGCNTVQGVGKDIKQGGEALERAGKK
jgi:predicted small secreted protein